MSMNVLTARMTVTLMQIAPTLTDHTIVRASQYTWETEKLALVTVSFMLIFFSCSFFLRERIRSGGMIRRVGKMFH